MRDFIDVYMAERKRVDEAGMVSSSFYGTAGHHNYLNCMLDLFLVRVDILLLRRVMDIKHAMK